MALAITGSLPGSAEDRRGRIRQARKPAPSLNIKTIWRVYSMSSHRRHKNTGPINQTYLPVERSSLHRARDIRLAILDCLLAKRSTSPEVMRAA